VTPLGSCSVSYFSSVAPTYVECEQLTGNQKGKDVSDGQPACQGYDESEIIEPGIPSIGLFKMPSYASDIMLLDQTLSETRLSSARSVFSHTFLLMAAKKSVDWGRVMPAWYAGHLAG
jgi:hypothetical protein